MTPQEKKYVVMSVLREAEITTSSDFVCAAYQICSRIDEMSARLMEHILPFEVDNHHENWTANVLYSREAIKKSDLSRLDLVLDGYNTVLTFLLLNDGVDVVYPLTEKDTIGWQIYKELQEKYNYVRKMNIYNNNGYLKNAS